MGLLFFTLTVQADIHEGLEMIQDAKCMECHNEEDFGTADSKAKTASQITSKVDACQRANDAEWFDDDTQTVSDYLNQTYYKFKKK